MADLDYPRMLFHRTQEPVTVHSRDEEEALGPDWSARDSAEIRARTPAPGARDLASKKSRTIRCRMSRRMIRAAQGAHQHIRQTEKEK